MTTPDQPLDAWLFLPRRLYLDTGTLQTVFDYGETIWQNESFVAEPREKHVKGLADEVEALRRIMQVNERAGFEFVVTNASLREVEARTREPAYGRWVYDVFDAWLVQAGVEEPALVSCAKLGSVSAKDWRLLADALAYRCDGFLTMERRLATQATVIERATGLRVVRPTTYWDLLAPWAGLYY